MNRTSQRAGLTLVELIVALGLLALLMLAVVQLFDRTLTTWRNGDTRRSLVDASSVVTELVTDDLRGIESGPRGDVLLEWVTFDTNGDGVRETKWPRLRLVRKASGAEVARLQRDMEIAATKTKAKTAPDTDVVKPERASPALVEVLWMVVPASIKDKDARSTGIVWRGERLVGDATTKSFFADDFFGGSNLPPAGLTQEVTGGVLWLDVLCATQTSVVHDGWKLSSEPAGATASWDAWSRARPDASIHFWNEAHPGAVVAKSRPILPRRVRIELELERPVDRLRRTRTLETIDNQEIVLRIDDERRVPVEPGALVLVDAEWMKITSIDARKIVVERGQRGTTAVPHEKDALVHWGMRMVTEATVATYREDWNL